VISADGFDGGLAAMSGARDPPFEIKAYGPDPGQFRIGLSPINPENWFEPATEDPRPRKARLLKSAPDTVWGEMACSRPGQTEALGLVCAWSGVPVSVQATEAPLLTAGYLVEDDLCLMERLGSGWSLTAASLCSASFFTPKETIGLALHDLHGPVPGFRDRFLTRVERIFDRLPADQILERRNWSVVNSGALSIPEASTVRAKVASISLNEAPDALFVRSERQTIRRLPATGGIIFSIRVWRQSLRHVLTDAQRADAFRKAWMAAMDAPDSLARTYKAFGLYDPLIRPLL